MDRILNPIVVLALLVSTIAAAITQPAAAPFSLTISTKTKSVQAGSEVKVQILLKNISNNEIYVLREKSPSLPEQAGFTAAVSDAKGMAVAYTNYGDKFYKGEAVTFGSPSYAYLKPGETLEQEMEVSKLFDLSKPGTYTVQVQRKDDRSAAVAKSNTISITITPDVAVQAK